MPIAEQVHAVLFEGKDPREAVTEALMQRELTAARWTASSTEQQFV